MTAPHHSRRWAYALIGILLLSAGCQATAVAIIPTALPSATSSFTPSPTRRPATDATPTARPTQAEGQNTGASSPTPLLGATRTALPPDAPTPTRLFNPNAPRIEFFTSDPLSIQPGSSVTLFWSARGISSAVIYRLDAQGNRTQVFNVAPDGNLPIDTRRTERGELTFVLSAGEGDNRAEQRLVIPLQCPIQWFFSPPPDDCPSEEAQEQTLDDQTFERGRLAFAQERNIIYILFNDGQSPAWLALENRYDPAIHPERDENAPPDFIQPLRELGFVWRTNEEVRNRLGLGLAEAVRFSGYLQSAPANQRENIYISGVNGEVLYLLPNGSQWLIIRPE